MIGAMYPVGTIDDFVAQCQGCLGFVQCGEIARQVDGADDGIGMIRTDAGAKLFESTFVQFSSAGGVTMQPKCDREINQGGQGMRVLLAQVLPVKVERLLAESPSLVQIAGVP